MQPLGLTSKAPKKPDPSPSRWRYRLHRWWLTPAFRGLVRLGLPLGVIALGAGLWISQPANQASLDALVRDAQAWVHDRPEFTVNAASVTGASGRTDVMIREALGLDFPLSSFDFDLEEKRAVLAALPPIEDVSLRVRSGGILDIVVTERVPVMVWRSEDGVALLDANGVAIAPLETRQDRQDLPLVYGAGAEASVGEALRLFATAGPILDEVRGLVRVGERRWDVVMTNGPRILLPEVGAVPALNSVILLNAGQDLLARDVLAVDLRNPDRPTLRLSEGAMDDMRRIKLIELVGEGTQ